MQPAQLETAGMDCAPVAMVGLVGCSRLARVALGRQCGSVGWDLDGYGRIDKQTNGRTVIGDCRVTFATEKLKSKKGLDKMRQRVKDA